MKYLVVGVFFLMVGLMRIIKPEWVMDFDRWYMARGTTQSPEDIDLAERVHKMNPVWAAFFIILGLAMILFSL